MLGQSKTPGAFGVFLHAEQDSFSHDGFGPDLGHLFSGQAPDLTFKNPTKADAMAADSYSYLVLGSNRLTFSPEAMPTNLVNIMPFIDAFNKARPGSKEQKEQLGKIYDYANKHRQNRPSGDNPAYCSSEHQSC